jgi:hypothetical protein
MRALILGLLVLAGCGSDPGLEGQWMYQNADASYGEALVFRGDGTYEMLKLWAGSPANVEKETGTFASTGSTFTVTPSTSTCPGVDPPATYGWRIAGGTLVVSASAGVMTFSPLTGTPSGNAALVFGCYVNGTWVPAQ